jgi:hypothetical protein
LQLKVQCHEIFAAEFFHESSDSRPLKITLRSFRICSKIRGDIRKSRCSAPPIKCNIKTGTKNCLLRSIQLSISKQNGRKIVKDQIEKRQPERIIREEKNGEK